MGKEKKKTAEWTVFLQGGAVTLWMYLVGLCLSAFLFIKGILPERMEFGVVAGLSFIAALVGGGLVARRSSFATMPAAMLNAAIFAGILLMVGMTGWQDTSFGEQSGILLLCALIGGLAAGVWGARKGKRRKKGKSRAGLK